MERLNVTARLQDRAEGKHASHDRDADVRRKKEVVSPILDTPDRQENAHPSGGIRMLPQNGSEQQP